MQIGCECGKSRGQLSIGNSLLLLYSNLDWGPCYNFVCDLIFSACCEKVVPVISVMVEPFRVQFFIGVQWREGSSDEANFIFTETKIVKRLPAIDNGGLPNLIPSFVLGGKNGIFWHLYILLESSEPLPLQDVMLMIFFLLFT